MFVGNMSGEKILYWILLGILCIYFYSSILSSASDFLNRSLKKKYTFPNSVSILVQALTNTLEETKTKSVSTVNTKACIQTRTFKVPKGICDNLRYTWMYKENTKALYKAHVYNQLSNSQNF